MIVSPTTDQRIKGSKGISLRPLAQFINKYMEQNLLFSIILAILAAAEALAWQLWDEHKMFYWGFPAAKFFLEVC